MKRSEVAYGAFELKRSYQTHLGWGITIGAMLHIAAIASIPFLVGPPAVESPVAAPPFEVVTRLFRLPDIERPTVSEPTAARPVPPDFGAIPIAVADADIPLEYVPPIWDTPSDGSTTSGAHVGMGSGTAGDLGTGSSAGDGLGDEPAPGVFVALESLPICVKQVAPEYPDMAQLTGREGSVVVRALVDRDGTVQRVEIVKSSGSNIGFDEAAVDAAKLCLYKPAIQNGMPVMVWVTYVVEFKLK